MRRTMRKLFALALVPLISTGAAAQTNPLDATAEAYFHPPFRHRSISEDFSSGKTVAQGRAQCALSEGEFVDQMLPNKIRNGYRILPTGKSVVVMRRYKKVPYTADETAAIVKKRAEVCGLQ